jgi:hypothetical protein
MPIQLYVMGAEICMYMSPLPVDAVVSGIFKLKQAVVDRHCVDIAATVVLTAWELAFARLNCSRLVNHTYER